MDDAIEVFKNYQEFLFRTIKREGPKLTIKDLERHTREQEEYEEVPYQCRKCKQFFNAKNCDRHFHRKLDKYDRQYIYGDSSSD